MSTSYERFRTILTMNLCSVLNNEQLQEVLKTVDVSMNDFDITRKQMDIIPINSAIPDVVKMFIASKAIANRSPKTLAQYKYKLLNFFDKIRKPYTDIHTNDIRMYLYTYKVEHSASDRYIENIRITLNGFFEWLVENEYISKNPCGKIESIKYQEKERKPLTPYELEFFRWNTIDIREKALIDFLFSTGCRVSECAAVRLSDIDWKNRAVFIRNGKGNKQRTVFFNAESELTLRKYLETRSDKTDAIFVSQRSPHQAIKQKAIENIITAVSKRTGMHVYPHLLRHTFATSGLHGGMPLATIQSLMGHANPRTTLIYAKQDTVDLQREHQRVYA